MGTLRFNFGLRNVSVGLIEKQYSAPVGLVGSFMFNIDVRRASGGLSGKQSMMHQTTRVLDSWVAPVGLWKQFTIQQSIRNY